MQVTVTGKVTVTRVAVAAFYFFFDPHRGLALAERIAEFVVFHNFLQVEYNRILNNGLLANSIQAFRQQFNPQCFTDEKVIDSLIWGFVVLLMNGGRINGQILYR